MEPRAANIEIERERSAASTLSIPAPERLAHQAAAGVTLGRSGAEFAALNSAPNPDAVM
jgi:hypothetical protein